MIAWNLATRGGSFLRISNCILLMFSVVKKCQFLETNFLFTIQIQKLLTYCFFAGICWHPLLFLPLFFLMFIWAAISYQLQEYIESGWTWCICQYNDCLKFGNSWGVKNCQNLVNLGNPLLSSILIQKLRKTYPKPTKMFNLLGFTHVFVTLIVIICFGPVYALQNSTPNISTPNFSFFF